MISCPEVALEPVEDETEWPVAGLHAALSYSSSYVCSSGDENYNRIVRS